MLSTPDWRLGVTELVEILRRQSLGVQVRPVRDGLPSWRVQGSALSNSEADYFSVCARRDAAGRPRLLLRQREPVLVVLLLTHHKGAPYILMSVRSEPGLIGLTCLSTTIQSTFSNYTRKHGGKATPYLDIALDPASSGRVLHESNQLDWGDVYEAKVKRFMVVEVGDDLEVQEGFHWVSVETANALLAEDDLITNDLRACLALIPGATTDGAPYPLQGGTSSRNARLNELIPASSDYVDLDELRFHEDGRVAFRDGAGRTVSFFRTRAPSREVEDWVQPLLRVSGRRRVWLFKSKAADEFAVRMGTQFGLNGRRVLLPSEPLESPTSNGEAQDHVAANPRFLVDAWTSGEGGRFFRHAIHVGILEAPGDSHNHPSVWQQGTSWLSRSELQALVLSPLATSLELRLAWSLAWTSRLLA